MSQSTGLVRKIDPKHSANLKMTEAYPAMPSDEALNSTAISGISFKANPMELNNAAEPVTTSKNVSQNNSYQPDQTIFNNLQRTNNQYLMNKNSNIINNNSNSNSNKNTTEAATKATAGKTTFSCWDCYQ